MLGDYYNEETRVEKLKRCCETRGRGPFLLLNSLLGLLSLAFVIFLGVILFKYDQLLQNKVFLFILPAIILGVIIISLSVIGICGVRYKRKPLLVLQAAILFFLVILGLLASFVIFILAGYLETLPTLGPYLINLDQNFQVQVFNDCCVGVAHVGSVVVACDELPAVPSNSSTLEECFDGELEWSDLVNADLCDALINVESKSHVGNSSAQSCGGGDFFVFAEDFDDFTNFYLQNFGIAVMFISVVIFLAFVLAAFQAFSTETRKRKTTYMFGDPNFDRNKRVNVYEDADAGNNPSKTVDRFYLEPAGQHDGPPSL